MEENKNPSSHLKARWQNALNVQHKEIYICIILPEAFDVSDIDQCARNLSCHANANCTNTIGSHVCTCHTGYTGDGQTCSGDFNKFPSMFRKVFMTREEQFYYCSFYTYNPSYSKREVIWNVLQNIQLWVVTFCAWSLSDIDECSKLNIWDEHASCSNTQGPYSCACNSRYNEDGLNCKG